MTRTLPPGARWYVTTNGAAWRAEIAPHENTPAMRDLARRAILDHGGRTLAFAGSLLIVDEAKAALVEWLDVGTREDIRWIPNTYSGRTREALEACFRLGIPAPGAPRPPAGTTISQWVAALLAPPSPYAGPAALTQVGPGFGEWEWRPAGTAGGAALPPGSAHDLLAWSETARDWRPAHAAGAVRAAADGAAWWWDWLADGLLAPESAWGGFLAALAGRLRLDGDDYLEVMAEIPGEAPRMSRIATEAHVRGVSDWVVSLLKAPDLAASALPQVLTRTGAEFADFAWAPLPAGGGHLPAGNELDLAVFADGRWVAASLAEIVHAAAQLGAADPILEALVAGTSLGTWIHNELSALSENYAGRRDPVPKGANLAIHPGRIVLGGLELVAAGVFPDLRIRTVSERGDVRDVAYLTDVAGGIPAGTMQGDLLLWNGSRKRWEPEPAAGLPFAGAADPVPAVRNLTVRPAAVVLPETGTLSFGTDLDLAAYSDRGERRLAVTQPGRPPRRLLHDGDVAELVGGGIPDLAVSAASVTLPAEGRIHFAGIGSLGAATAAGRPRLVLGSGGMDAVVPTADELPALVEAAAGDRFAARHDPVPAGAGLVVSPAAVAFPEHGGIGFGDHYAVGFVDHPDHGRRLFAFDAALGYRDDFVVLRHDIEEWIASGALPGSRAAPDAGWREVTLATGIVHVPGRTARARPALGTLRLCGAVAPGTGTFAAGTGTACFTLPDAAAVAHDTHVVAAGVAADGVPVAVPLQVRPGGAVLAWPEREGVTRVELDGVSLALAMTEEAPPSGRARGKGKGGTR